MNKKIIFYTLIILLSFNIVCAYQLQLSLKINSINNGYLESWVDGTLDKVQYTKQRLCITHQSSCSTANYRKGCSDYYNDLVIYSEDPEFIFTKRMVYNTGIIDISQTQEGQKTAYLCMVVEGTYNWVGDSYNTKILCDGSRQSFSGYLVCRANSNSDCCLLSQTNYPLLYTFPVQIPYYNEYAW